MFAENQIVEYWCLVRAELREQFGLSENEAKRAVESYRELLERDGVGEILYHDSPGSVAKTVAGGWKQGLLRPGPQVVPKR